MPKRKITAELWQQLLTAYQEWEPGTLEAPSIDELIAPFGVSKQAFYAELNRQGVPLKGRRASRPIANKPAVPVAGEVDPLARMLMEELVTARLRCAVLEQALTDAGLQIP